MSMTMQFLYGTEQKAYGEKHAIIPGNGYSSASVFSLSFPPKYSRSGLCKKDGLMMDFVTEEYVGVVSGKGNPPDPTLGMVHVSLHGYVMFTKGTRRLAPGQWSALLLGLYWAYRQLSPTRPPPFPARMIDRRLWHH